MFILHQGTNYMFLYPHGFRDSPDKATVRRNLVPIGSNFFNKIHSIPWAFTQFVPQLYVDEYDHAALRH